MKLDSTTISPPYVVMKRVVRIMTTMCKRGYKQRKLSDLATLLDSSVSSLQNAVSTLKALGFAYVEEDHLMLTDCGVDFCQALVEDRVPKAKTIVAEAIEQNEILRFVRSLVDERGTIRDADVGRAISKKFSKDWKSTGFIRAVGRACSSILAYAGHAYWKNGLLSIEPITIHSELPMYPPELYYNQLVNILLRTSRYDRITPSDLTEKEEVPKGKLSGYLAVAQTLGMIEKDDFNAYSLTDEGWIIADPLAPQEQKSKVFREAIVGSPYIEVARRLAALDAEFNANKVGETLAFWMRRRWKNTVQNHYGKKLLNWFREAGLVEESGRGIYRMKLLEAEEDQITESIPQPPLDSGLLTFHFSIGRLLGILEGMGAVDESLTFESTVSALMSRLGKFPDLSVLLESLPQSFEMMNQLKAPVVYLNSVKFLTDKVRDKLETASLEGCEE